MTRTLIARTMSAAVAAALCLGALSACTAQTSAVTEEQQANRDYMSQVNQDMEDLSTNLDAFVEAVSRQDTVTMRLQADNALAAIDDLDALEAPEALAGVQESYKSGADQLRSALNDYIALYTELEDASSSSSDSFDWSTYDARIASIQAQYDAGVAALEQADQTAASME